MKIGFHGAARTVTGSKHLLHIHPNKKVLLDCGMFQGMGKETFALNREFGFEPSQVDYVILSHAHIDHIGLLPKLVKDGFAGIIYCTKATAALAEILLRDSAAIQDADARYATKMKQKRGINTLVEPLYTIEDVDNVLSLLQVLSYDVWHTIDKQIEVMFTNVGHIIGASAVHLKVLESNKLTRLTFSGDIGRYSDVILQAPTVFPQADVLIMESTYGDSLHALALGAKELILKHIEYTCLRKKGKLIIPSFSVGRTQELLYALNQLELENRLPKLRYIVDSPLSILATRVVKQFPELFNVHLQKVLQKDEDPFAFSGLEFTANVEESKALNDSKQPMVIISASGMAEAGRVKHHIANSIENANHTILLVGYCEPQSLGGRLKLKPEKVGIYGEEYLVKADIEMIDTMSAHADYAEMSQWLACQDPSLVKKLFLVHGEYDVQLAFKNRLLKKGFVDVEIPERHQVFGLG